MKTVAIVVPHPDDFTFLASHPAQLFIKKRYKVYEILMTGGEYGLLNHDHKKLMHFKGKRLQKIRSHENTLAKREYGIDSEGKSLITTIKVGYIDGHVPLSQQSIKRLNDILNTITPFPTIILAPDPVFSIDWHKDHMNTAWNMYFLIKRLKSTKTIKYLIYQSYNSNRNIPRQSWDIYKNALSRHRSQVSPRALKFMTFLLKYIYSTIKWDGVGLREYDLDSNYSDTHLNLKNRLLRTLFYRNIPPIADTALYQPPPQDLGLSINPSQR